MKIETMFHPFILDLNRHQIVILKVLYYGHGQSIHKLEYVYAALLLHKLNKDITEDNVKNVIKATGANQDEVKVKELVAALSEVNIDESLKSTPMAMAVPATAAAADSGATEAKDEKKEEKKDEKKEEEALEGLSSLFG